MVEFTEDGVVSYVQVGVPGADDKHWKFEFCTLLCLKVCKHIIGKEVTDTERDGDEAYDR